MKSNYLLTFWVIMLFSYVLNAQTIEIDKAKSEISELLKNKASILKTLEKDDLNYDKNTRYPWGDQGNISVLEDRMEFRRKKESVIIFFSELDDYDIYATTDEKENSGAILGEFLIMLDGKEKGKKLADNLILIQDRIHTEIWDKRYGSQLILFEPIAAQYRALKLKPAVSEEQRKYIVQANSFNELRDFNRAIALFGKAIGIDETSYPAAYSNLALLSAQIRNYDAAIYYMKKYLMLEPEAADARSAQDKIYVWEAQIGR